MKTTHKHTPSFKPLGQPELRNAGSAYTQPLPDVTRRDVRSKIAKTTADHAQPFEPVDEAAFQEHQSVQADRAARKALDQKRRDKETAPVRELAKQKTIASIAERTNRDAAELTYWNEQVNWEADIVKAHDGRELCTTLTSDKRLKPLLMQAASLWRFISKVNPSLVATELPPKGPVEKTTGGFRAKLSRWWASTRIVVNDSYIPEWDDVSSMAFHACGSPTSREKIAAFLEKKIAAWKKEYLVKDAA